MIVRRATWRHRLVAGVAALLAGAVLTACSDGTAEPDESVAAAPSDTGAGEPSEVEDTPVSEAATTAGGDGSAPPATGEPELCEDLAAVRTSVETMRDATIGDGAVPVVAEELRNLETALPELRAAAADEFGSQVQEVEAGAEAVRTSVEAAQADTSAATVLAVTTAVRALGETVDGLVEDVGSTC